MGVCLYPRKSVVMCEHFAEDDASGVWDGEGAAEGARGRRLETSLLVACAPAAAE